MKKEVLIEELPFYEVSSGVEPLYTVCRPLPNRSVKTPCIE